MPTVSRLVSRSQHRLRGARRRLRNAVRDLAARPDDAPVFVFGHQKSGTTAIAALLAEAIGVGFSNDMIFHRRWRDGEALLRGEVPPLELRRRAPAEFACGVIKDPDFTFIAGDLAAAFPRAQLVGLVRDPARNVKSILERLDLPGDLPDLDPADPRLDPYPLWRSYFDPRPLGLTPGAYVEVLARRWRAALERMEAVGERCPILRYEDFLADKAGFIDGLAARLGRPIVQDVTASLDQQFQPRGNASVSVERFFGPDNLARIEAVCAPAMARYSYATATTQAKHSA